MGNAEKMGTHVLIKRLTKYGTEGIILLKQNKRSENVRYKGDKGCKTRKKKPKS